MKYEKSNGIWGGGHAPQEKWQAAVFILGVWHPPDPSNIFFGGACRPPELPAIFSWGAGTRRPPDPLFFIEGGDVL